MSYAIIIIYNQTDDSAFKSSLAKPTSIIIPWAEKQTLPNTATMEWTLSQKQHYPNGTSIAIF